MKLLLTTSVAALMLVGCTSLSSDELAALRADVAESKALSQKAHQLARQANVNALDAKSLAVQADEKLNRVFRKSQMK